MTREEFNSLFENETMHSYAIFSIGEKVECICNIDYEDCLAIGGIYEIKKSYERFVVLDNGVEALWFRFKKAEEMENKVKTTKESVMDDLVSCSNKLKFAAKVVDDFVAETDKMFKELVEAERAAINARVTFADDRNKKMRELMNVEKANENELKESHKRLLDFLEFGETTCKKQ